MLFTRALPADSGRDPFDQDFQKFPAVQNQMGRKISKSSFRKICLFSRKSRNSGNVLFHLAFPLSFVSLAAGKIKEQKKYFISS